MQACMDLLNINHYVKQVKGKESHPFFLNKATVRLLQLYTHQHVSVEPSAQQEHVKVV